MRSLPMLWRMTEDLRRLAMPSSPIFDNPWTTSRVAPWNQLSRLIEEDLAKISKDGYKVSMNVAEFKPEELTVKVADNNVIVEGKSEEHHENGYITRHFLRKVALPSGFVADNAFSSLSKDGVLTVSVPKPLTEEKAREIPIQQIETPAAKPKEVSSSAENATKSLNEN